MAHTWSKHLTIIGDINSGPTINDIWTPVDIPRFSTLLRTIIFIYGCGTGVIPNSPDLQPGVPPLCWALQEQGSDIVPVFSIGNPFQWNEEHVISSGLCTMAITGAVQRLNTTGTATLTGFSEYTITLTDADLPLSTVVANGYDDSKAQRYFSGDIPQMNLTLSIGALSTDFFGLHMGVVATTQQLWNLPF